MEKDPLTIALKKLSYRAYSQKELEYRLCSMGFEQEQVEVVIDKLKGWGYIDDKKLASYWYEYYTNHKACGSTYINNKLKEKGFDRQIINSVMVDYDEEKELKMVETEAQKYINNNSEKNPPAKLKERLVRHLQRKGFSDTLIIKIINYNFPELTD